jgi:hypothetical protein
VTGQRSRNRILRERLYLETLTNHSKVTNVTATNTTVSLRPLDTTTTPPTPQPKAWITKVVGSWMFSGSLPRVLSPLLPVSL